MTIIDTAMLWRQFGAAIDMLGDTLRDCPDDLWEKRLWEDQPDQWVAAGFSTFWYLGYHTLFRLSPQPYNRSVCRLRCKILSAAFLSRSITSPQCAQICVRSLNSFSTSSPQSEHLLDV